MIAMIYKILLFPPLWLRKIFSKSKIYRTWITRQAIKTISSERFENQVFEKGHIIGVFRKKHMVGVLNDQFAFIPANQRLSIDKSEKHNGKMLFRVTSITDKKIFADRIDLETACKIAAEFLISKKKDIE